MVRKITLGFVGVSMLVGVLYTRSNQGVVSSVYDTPSVEYFASSESFSEVEGIRARLRALARRSVYSARLLQVETLQDTAGNQGAVVASRRDVVSQSVEELNEALRDFKGTAEEAVILHCLLMSLARAGSHDEWINVYLDFLYRRSTDPLIGEFAAAAIRAAWLAGRYDEVIQALRHVNDIPFDFEGKHQVKVVLLSVAPLVANCDRESAEHARASL